MVQHHVTYMVAILFCNLLLCIAASAPSAALIKLLAAKHSYGSGSVDDDVISEMFPEDKRFHPSAFFGSRGKRVSEELSQPFEKRFQQGFVGSRGKRLTPYLREEEMGADEEEGSMAKRFDPSGFAGSRGKRYLPGLEALLLTQMYKKLDAEKWKRQSLLGFHAARG